MNPTIALNDYNESQACALAKLYYQTIHKVNKTDYSDTQLEAWAPAETQLAEGWTQRFKKTRPIVATIDDKVVGFVEFIDNGYIDCFFVHYQHQNQGVGSTLMEEISRRAKTKSINRVWANVSVTAKPFFSHAGFTVLKEQLVELRGCKLKNYLMEKRGRN